MRRALWIGLAVLGIVLGGVAEGSVEQLPLHHYRLPRKVECELCGKVKEVAVLHPVHGALCKECEREVRAHERQRQK